MSDHATSGGLRLPMVQLIGAQKAGTSAIADWLFEEGDFSRPIVFEDEPWYYGKEVHFFDVDHRYCQGVNFYAKRFVGMEASRSCMDATPDSLAFPERVHAIYDAAADPEFKAKLKIIVILRDPVSRELSLYNHLAFDCRHLDPTDRTSWHSQVLKEDGTIMTFDEFVELRTMPALLHRDTTSPGRSTRYSLYAEHLSRWFELFDRNQILVLSYQELREDPGKLQDRIQDFLQMNIPGSPKWANVNESPLKVRSPSVQSRTRLQQAFAPHNEELYALLRDHPGPSMEQRPFAMF